MPKKSKRTRIDFQKVHGRPLVLILLLVAILSALKVIVTFQSSLSNNPGADSDSHVRSIARCEDLSPGLLIVVLTSTRQHSLIRLLESVAKAKYGCTVVDLQINIDIAAQLNSTTLAATAATVRVAIEFVWVHGKKHVFRRLGHAGLSRSWFEIPYYGNYEYVAVLEDDMQLSPHFYTFFSLLHSSGSFHAPDVTAFCLHPNDWEVRVEMACKEKSHSSYLYTSPEPCNWGPIWKYSEWRKYVDWVFAMKARGELPFVPENVAYEFNNYLRAGKDVQSSWVWRYNMDFGKRQVRYSFAKCSGKPRDEKYFAINHKEPGEHFKKKLNLQNDPSLLVFDYQILADLLLADEAQLIPRPFLGYVKGAKSLRG